jgi:hypothetical protein
VDQLKPRCGREGLWRWCKEEQVFHPSHRYRQFWIWCSKVKYLPTIHIKAVEKCQRS